MAVAYGSNPSQLNSYRTQAVLALTPGQVVLRMYDLALVALMARDGRQACKVLAQLIDCLDFQFQDIPVGLFRLYRYCMEEVRKDEYEVPATILRELRDTWAEALAQSGEGAP